MSAASGTSLGKLIDLRGSGAQSWRPSQTPVSASSKLPDNGAIPRGWTSAVVKPALTTGTASGPSQANPQPPARSSASDVNGPVTIPQPNLTSLPQITSNSRVPDNWEDEA